MMDGLRWHIPQEGGGFVTEVLLQDPSRINNKIWLYRPMTARQGVRPMPCVVMAAAGSRLFHGMPLAQGDQTEHITYLAHNIAVVACEIDGTLTDDQLDDTAALARAAKQFTAADAGIANLRAAVAVARSLSWVDKNRIYLAGHSSAATLALQTAAYEPSIAGVIAHAPEVNVSQHVAGVVGLIESAGAPNLRVTLDALSPHNNVSRISKPTFLFCAEDDDVISPGDVKSFAETLRKTNSKVTLDTVSSGGHYESMIREGIPHAAEWINKGP